MNTDNKSKRSTVENSIPEVKAPNGDKSSNDSKNGRTNTISPKSGIILPLSILGYLPSQDYRIFFFMFPFFAIKVLSRRSV